MTINVTSLTGLSLKVILEQRFLKRKTRQFPQPFSRSIVYEFYECYSCNLITIENFAKIIKEIFTERLCLVLCPMMNSENHAFAIIKKYIKLTSLGIELVESNADYNSVKWTPEFDILFV